MNIFIHLLKSRCEFFQGEELDSVRKPSDRIQTGNPFILPVSITVSILLVIAVIVTLVRNMCLKNYL